MSTRTDLTATEDFLVDAAKRAISTAYQTAFGVLTTLYLGGAFHAFSLTDAHADKKILGASFSAVFAATYSAVKSGALTYARLHKAEALELAEHDADDALAILKANGVSA